MKFFAKFCLLALGVFPWALSSCFLLEEPKKDKTTVIGPDPTLFVLTDNLNDVDHDPPYLIVKETVTNQQVVVPHGQVNFSFPKKLKSGSNFRLEIVQQPAFQRCGFEWDTSKGYYEPIEHLEGNASTTKPELICGYTSYPVQAKLYGVAADQLKDIRISLAKTRGGNTSNFSATPTAPVHSFNQADQRLVYGDSYRLTATSTLSSGAKTVIINANGNFNNAFVPPKDSVVALAQPASGDLVTTPVVNTPATSGIFSYSRIKATVGVCPLYNPLKTAPLKPTKDANNRQPSDPSTEELLYLSSDPSVVTVDPENGMLTLQKAGIATITVQKAEKSNPFYPFSTQSFVVEANAPTGALRTGLCPARIEFAQNLSLDVHNNSHSKTPLALRKKTLVRVLLTSSRASASEHPLEVPTNRLRSVKAIKADGQPLLTVNLTCPEIVLPLNETAYSKDWTCYGTIPENSLTEKVRFVADISDDSAGTFEVKPEFYDSEKVEVVIVPTCFGSYHASNVPDSCQANTNSRNMTEAELKDAIYQAFPLAKDAITVRTTSNWIIPVGLLSGSSVDWDNTVTALRKLMWDRESGKNLPYYLAFIYNDEKKFVSGTIGIAFLRSAGDFSYGDAALATDMPSFKKTTAIHELGHGFSLNHGPCNFRVLSPEYIDYNYPNWPKDSALPGAGYAKVKAAAYDPLTDSVSKPDHDIMSYCSGTTLSPYGLAWTSIYLNPEMNLYLHPTSPAIASETNLAKSTELVQLVGAPTGQSVAAAYSYVIDGKIEKKLVNGVESVEASFSRVRKTSAPYREASGKDYLLRVIFEDGRIFKQEFSAQRTMDNGEKDDSYFLLSVPDWGKIARLELISNGRTLATKGEMPLPAISNPVGDASKLERQKRSLGDDDGGVSLQVRGDQLELRWNNQAYPWLTLVFVADDGKKEVLLMEKTGGVAAASIAKLSRGGKFEVSLSDGLNSILTTHPR